MTGLSDAELVEQAQAGRSEAVSTLYRRHQPAIFRYVLSKIYQQEQAQDITSEIFLRMVTALPQYEVTAVPFTVWLFRIAHNSTITYRKKEYAKQLVPITQTELASRPEENPAAAVERNLEVERLRQGLQQIDEAQRDVLILRFLVGMPLKEVAQTLDKTVGAVKTLQHRGTLALRVALQANSR